MTGSFFFDFFFPLQDLFLLRVIEIVYVSTSAQSDQKKANTVKSYLQFFIRLQWLELSVPSVFPFAFLNPSIIRFVFFFYINHSDFDFVIFFLFLRGKTCLTFNYLSLLLSIFIKKPFLY